MSESGLPAIGVDIGGTTITSAAVPPDGTIAHRNTLPTPADRDGDTVLETVVSAVEAARADAGGRVRGIGIATAGPLDAAAGTVSPVNIPGLRDYPLLARLRERYSDLPVALDGDGLCMALGEYRHGAGRGCTAMLGMVVSTGVGGGIVLGGNLLRGPSGNAGHIGHTVADPEGEACPCGSRGCVETMASGTSLARWARACGWTSPDGRQDARALAESARAGDPVANRAFQRGGRVLGMAVTNAAALIDLDRVVIGGGVAQAGDLLFDPIRAAVAEFARMPFLHRLTVHRSALGDLAGLLGAAELV